MKRQQKKKRKRNKHCFLVDTLNDVDLSAVGPSAITKSPKSRPYGATERHGFKVSNKETMVQFLRGGDTNAMTEKNGRIKHARPSTTLQERRTNHAARRVEDRTSCQLSERPFHPAAHRQAPFSEPRVLTNKLLGRQ